MSYSGKNQFKDLKDGFAYVLKSERLKSLILCSALIVSLLSILLNYYVSLFEDLKISAFAIGIIAAIGSLMSALASKRQYSIQERLKNKTLSTVAIILSTSTIVAGLFGIKSQGYAIIAIIVIMYLIYQLVNGIYYTIIDKYLRNFTNEKIDTKIFATTNLFAGIFRVLAGLFASFLLDKTSTSYCMIIIGAIFTILYMLMKKYMSTRVGLKPEQYSNIERKYDEQK